MNDTSGPTSGTQFAYYDHDSHSWKMWPGTGLWGSIEFSETWPKTGCMSDGRAYELPTSVPPITANDSSSWLPTPRSSRGGSATETMYALGGVVDYSRRPQGEVVLPTPRAADPKASMGSPGAARHVVAGMGSLAEVIGVHLPTPTVSDTKGAAQRPGRTRGGRLRPDSDERLAGAVQRFLPTPKASARGDCPSESQRRTPDLIAVSHYFPESTGAITDPLFAVGSD